MAKLSPCYRNNFIIIIIISCHILFAIRNLLIFCTFKKPMRDTLMLLIKSEIDISNM